MNELSPAITADITTINSISVVPVILEVICRTTGMGFAVVARVTKEQWVACSVRDDIKFGLMPGGQLKLDTTICHEIRQSGNAVVIDHVQEDTFYNTHHTPAMYGFQSYISVPIISQEGQFFGTLCAIDPKPSLLNTPEIVGMFRAYADLLSLYLNMTLHPQDAAIQHVQERISSELKQHLNTILSYGKNIADNTEEQPLSTINRSDSTFKGIVHESTARINGLLAQLKATA